MSYQVALTFEDGLTRFIKCNTYETVADAAYKARINIPFDCRDGACGTCKAFCESGNYDAGEYIDEALTEDEADKGFCLPCQMVPESDLVLQISGTAEMAKTGAQTFQAKIADLHWFADNTAGFTLDIENRDELSFLPGQYMNVAVPGTDAVRSYSFSSGPGSVQLKFLVRTAPDGAMTGYLKDRAQTGDVLELTGPMGSFFLRDIKRPTLMLAGGTGIAPLLAMLEKLDTTEQGHPLHPIHLVYGVTFDKDLVELDKLEYFAERIKEFTFDYCVADPDSAAEKKGYVTQHIAEEQLNGGDVDVYLCGPPAMVDAVRKYWDGQGIVPENFYYERFAVGSTSSVKETGEEHEGQPGHTEVSGDNR
ncbi:benzoate 1,2-dioxygenase electron transfer component BenC [Arthrobacter crystallopoietes]|uniref:Benzoate/toluate 1,2-dioxygenase reductase subunit n=1 Tax=Crystallibacter crystallopoietes TaxID=37928 RepID=A0A1H1DUG9_9MICC|nr:benzoate 1,2-dioxygenase electron transfer component BenC [Arthrobacter crystallopoietes]AUI50164.1 NADH oxidase [Arthrobacter crystallopoietes]SDQ80043.1 benzoate/toluate 1,2-dioxygenase reductase subunit [Arthrobacter crystallopoietes]